MKPKQLEDTFADNLSVTGYDWYPLVRKDSYIAGNLPFILEQVKDMISKGTYRDEKFMLYVRGDESEETDVDSEDTEEFWR